MNSRKTVALVLLLALLVGALWLGMGWTDRSEAPDRQDPAPSAEEPIAVVPAEPEPTESESGIAGAPGRGVLRVQVVSTVNGDPVAGARVERWDRSRARWQSFCPTDAAGRFTVAIPVKKYTLRLRATGFGHLRREFTPDDAETGEIVLRLEPTRAITGQVVDRAGAPAAGAAVLLIDPEADFAPLRQMREERSQRPRYARLFASRPGRLRATADEDGRFELPLHEEDGPRMLVVGAHGFWPGVGPLVDAAAAGGPPLRVVLQKGPMLRMRLRDTSGRLLDSDGVNAMAEILLARPTETSRPVIY